MVEPIGEMLGADRVIATRLQIEDGRYTGEIEFYAYAENKAAAIRDLALREGYDLAAVLRLQRLHHRPADARGGRQALAVNPDRSLRKEAVARDWPVLVFDRPIELHRRLPEFRAPSRTVVAAVAIGTAAVTAGLVWQLAKRRQPVG